MTDVLDRLRADNPVKAGSAPSIDEVWARLQQDPNTAQRRLRTPWKAAAATISIIIPLAVAALALGLLGHHPSARSSTSSPSPTRSTERSVPTLGQLLANFAVLRRPQTAADRSWQPDTPVNARGVPRFTRLARRLPNGDRVFLSIERFTQAPGGHRPPASSYSLDIDIVSPHGNDAGTSFGPNVNYTVVPISSISSLGLRAAAGKVPTWASIIPDGVTRVRWRFGCPQGHGHAARCGQQRPVTVTAPVRGNVAAASVPGTSEICTQSHRLCRVPVAITWYGTDGRVLASYRPFAMHNLTAPPFITTRGSSATATASP